jgi:hypothetical protein
MLPAILADHLGGDFFALTSLLDLQGRRWGGAKKSKKSDCYAPDGLIVYSSDITLGYQAYQKNKVSFMPSLKKMRENGWW